MKQLISFGLLFSNALCFAFPAVGTIYSRTVYYQNIPVTETIKVIESDLEAMVVQRRTVAPGCETVTLAKAKTDWDNNGLFHFIVSESSSAVSCTYPRDLVEYQAAFANKLDGTSTYHALLITPYGSVLLD